MDRDEKIRMLENFCGTWESCEDGKAQCPMTSVTDDCCAWDDMTDDELDKCIGVIDALHANVQIVNPSNAKPDMVCHPPHYNQGGVECIDAIKAATVNKHGIEAVCVANVIKYVWRYEAKNGLEDVKKAAWYLNRLIAELEAKSE